MLHPDRLLPSEASQRAVARAIYEQTRSLPIVSPHGHCSPIQFATNASISEPAAELVSSDHYLLRMLYSRGIPLEALGRAGKEGHAETDGRLIWQRLADNYHLFRGTPSQLWLDHTLSNVFGLQIPLTSESAGAIYDSLTQKLASDAYRPRQLYERFGIEFLATTDSPLSDLSAHRQIQNSDWPRRVVPTFRPDDVVDPDLPGFADRVLALGELTGCDTSNWHGYLQALRVRREEFIAAGATASDHGHPSAATANLSGADARALFGRVMSGRPTAEEAELFRGQVLTEMAAMSLEDGMAMQLHVGAWRDHNASLYQRFGRDIGADIPRATDYVAGLKALLDRYGNEVHLRVIVYTLDESTLSRELAPLAGHYPALYLGPPWWFLDSPHGIRRFYEGVVETAGFYNTVGFNDDARSLLTIPARHDAARRLNAGYLATLVTEGRIDEVEAGEVALDLAYNLPRSAFRTG